MESSNNNSIRKFTNWNIIKIDKETLESELYKENVIGENIKINGSTAYVSQSYDLKIMILPNVSYNLARDHYIQSYKLLKLSNNFPKIKRYFLIGYSHLSIKQSVFLSAYNFYATNQDKKLLEIDQNVYSDLLKNPIIKKYTEKFEINSYSSSTFHEEGGTIKEVEEEYIESFEDCENTFDIHVVLLNHLNDYKAKIVPIWININNLSNSQEILEELGNVFKEYLNQDENFFIFSTNLTYFGRLYNYFGDPTLDCIKEFRSKTFLRDQENETRVKMHLKSIDDAAIDSIKLKNTEVLCAVSNFNYCKELFICLINMLKGNKELISETLAYLIKRFESIDDGYEINLISYAAIVFLKK